MVTHESPTRDYVDCKKKASAHANRGNLERVEASCCSGISVLFRALLVPWGCMENFSSVGAEQLLENGSEFADSSFLQNVFRNMSQQS